MLLVVYHCAQFLVRLNFCRGLESLKSLVFGYLDRDFVEGRDSMLKVIKKTSIVAVVNHCVLVLTTLLSRICSPRKLHSQDLPKDYARMRDGSFKMVLFLLLPNVLEGFYGIMVKRWDAGMRFEPVVA